MTKARLAPGRRTWRQCRSVYHQSWFDDASFPANLPGIWDGMLGYPVKQNIAPVLIGEFGTTLVEAKDATWLKALMAYMGKGNTGMRIGSGPATPVS